MQIMELSRAVIEGHIDRALKLTQEALKAGVSAQKIYREGLIPGMEVVGKKMQSGEYFIPEVLLSAQVMKQALEVIRPTLMQAKSQSPLARVVMGTVQGDLHDIGKNLVTAMLEGAGFEVTDLGVDTPASKFVTAVRETSAKILGLSALLSVTMLKMKDVINSLEEAGIRRNVKVIIGGASVSKGFAEEIGADGYAADAGSAVDLSKHLVNMGDR
jgi:5-methyltetrahydrofolate--homocysteine methyltransferase